MEEPCCSTADQRAHVNVTPLREEIGLQERKESPKELFNKLAKRGGFDFEFKAIQNAEMVK